MLAGELLILLRINAVYGWSRKSMSHDFLATYQELTWPGVVVFTLFLFCGEDHHPDVSQR
jgi:hypothetical protein